MLVGVLCGGEGFPLGILRPWLRACDQLVAADGGLMLLKDLGLRANVVIGDLDSLPPDGREWQALADRIVPLQKDKDDSDAEAAIAEALRLGADDIWLVGGTGGRMDHWLSNLRMVGDNHGIRVWLTPHEIIRRLAPGASMILFPGRVSIFPLGNGPWKLTDDGLTWPVSQVDFSRWHSLSNRTEKPMAKLRGVEGDFLVFQEWADRNPEDGI